MITLLSLVWVFCHFSAPSKMLSFLYIFSPSGYFSLHSASASLFVSSLSFSHFSASLPLLFIFLHSFFYFSFFPLSMHPLLSPHSISPFPRAYLGVIWRMGLQHRGQGTWCSSCHCHGDLHHDAGPGSAHSAEVELPRDAWQKEL